jgi:hypothetical protein
VAVGAITGVLVSERRRLTTSRARAQRLAAVVLVTVSLFPCVSASDDLISFAYVSAGTATRSGFGHSVPDNSGADPVIFLVLQNLEHLQISTFYTLFVAFSFFGLVCFSTPRSVLRQLPSSTSRGPPEFAFIR